MDCQVEIVNVPGFDRKHVWISRRSREGRLEILQADGSWVFGADENGNFTDATPTLAVDGMVWRSLRPALISALGALPEAAADTEVRVLREWLYVERSRTDMAFRAGLDHPVVES